MKVFITKKDIENEYGITKVSDSLVADFKCIYGDKIVIEGNSIQDAMLKLASMNRDTDIPFNPVLQKLKAC